MKTFFQLYRRWYSLFLIIIFFFSFSCKSDFLDIPPQGQLKGDNFFISSDQAVQSVTAIYAHLREWKVTGFAHLAITSIPSDDAEKGSVAGDAGFLNQFDNFTFTSTQQMINDYWNGQYQGINLCNQSIEKIPPILMDDNLKKRLIAEAKFLRAYHYFNLVRAYGGVPKVDKLPETPEELNPIKASKEDIYAFIESDLNEAIQNLPVNYSSADIGRSTKGAALTMLAKVKMYEKKWSDVLSLTDQIMALPYSLSTDFYEMFRISGENNSESIFEVQNNTYTADCGNYSQYSEIQTVRPRGWGFNVPTTDLSNSFEAGDKRKIATIQLSGQTTPSGDLIPSTSPNPMYNQKVYVPFNAPNACGYGIGRDYNRRVYRLAEVILMNAEAANEQNQNAKALTSINMIRKRAGLSDLNIADQTQFRLAIWKERRVELAMEDDRFFDLVRQGRAGEILRAQGKGFVDGKNEVFPIPQQQIDLSGGKLVQNPGYN